MKLDNQSLINEFFEKERFNFPELSYEQFRDIVTGPWRHLKTLKVKGFIKEDENGKLKILPFLFANSNTQVYMIKIVKDE